MRMRAYAGWWDVDVGGCAWAAYRGVGRGVAYWNVYVLLLLCMHVFSRGLLFTLPAGTAVDSVIPTSHYHAAPPTYIAQQGIS